MDCKYSNDVCVPHSFVLGAEINTKWNGIPLFVYIKLQYCEKIQFLKTHLAVDILSDPEVPVKIGFA